MKIKADEIVYTVPASQVRRIAEQFKKRTLSDDEVRLVITHFVEFLALNEAVEWAAAIYCNEEE